MVVRKLLIGVGVVVTSSSIYFASVSERSVVTDRKRILLYPLWYESWKGAHKYADQKKTTTIVTNHPMSRSLNESFSKIKTVGVSNLLIEEESRFGRRGKNKLKKISENTKGELVIVHNDILEKNAQCFAGGHVIVEERIFQMLSEKESRVLLCHEYAHCILRHHNEKGFIANTCLVLHILILVLHIPIVIKGLIRFGSPKYWDIAILHYVASKVWESLCHELIIKPHSRMTELEADKVGIMIHRCCGWQDKIFIEAVHKICCDEGYEVVMKVLDGNRFLKWRLERASTHPTNKIRIQMIEEFMNSSNRLNSQVDLDEPAQEVDEDHPTDPGLHESEPPSCDSISLSLFSQEHGGDINEAVNSHFSEGDRSTIKHPTSIQASQNDLMDIDDEAVEVEPQRPTFPLLSATQQLNPFSLLDSNFCRSFLERHSAAEFTSGAPRVTHPREVRQIPIEFKDEHTSGLSPAIENVTGTAHANFPEAHGTVIVDEEDDEDIPTVPTAPRLDRVADYWNDIEQEMIRAATEASRCEVVEGFPNQHIGDMTDSSGPSLQQTHSQIEDPDLARAVSLSLKERSKENHQHLRLIQEHVADGDLFAQVEQDVPHASSLTPAEQEIIEQFVAMGFSRTLVIEIFLAFGRSEELATNYLVENAGDS